MGISRNDPVRDIAIAIKRLSYEEMIRLDNAISEERRQDGSSEARVLLNVATKILGPDFDINAPTTRG